MSRQLRTRTSRPNYAALSGLWDDDEAGPSTVPVESDGSGSEFEFDAGQQAEEEVDDDAFEEADEKDDEDDVFGVTESPIRRRTTSTREPSLSASAAGPRKKSTQSKTAFKRPAAIATGLSYTTTSRSTHVLPNTHHRHRFTGLYPNAGKIERLSDAPAPLAPELTTETNAWATDTVQNRVNKSWGYNVGPGPLWELVEDRAWYKEAFHLDKTTEKGRRPRVYQDISLRQYQVLKKQEASRYLPRETDAPSGERSPSLIACSFGPFNKQTRLELKPLNTVKMSQFFSESNSHVFHAGAPVWGLDWCPIHADDRAHLNFKQYLAVAPFTNVNPSPKIGLRVRRPSPACIQLWSLGPSISSGEAMDIDNQAAATDAGEMRCEMIMCIESGSAFELKWCPLPTNDAVTDTQNTPRKLGLIAGTFEDGSFSVYAVPDPASIGLTESVEEAPLYVNLSEPLLRIELEETCCWSFDWANSEVIAIGCTNGYIAVYNISEALHSNPSSTPLLPTHYFNVHQSAIRTLAWVRAPVYSPLGEETSEDPTVIVSGGYDGVECVTDIRDMCGNALNRTRDVVTAICYSPYSGSAVTIDHENSIKAYSISPKMLGRGHYLLEPNGPIWSLSASDHHPQLAIGVSDGSCITTNTMRTTRRGGLIPFWEHKIYQLDYSRTKGEYRMLEHFHPTETHNRQAATRQNKTIPVGTGAWPREVAIQRVVWNDGNGLARTPMLASATGAGLCRVDWLLGRWGRDPPPYYGVEGIRGEKETAGSFPEDEESD